MKGSSQVTSIRWVPWSLDVCCSMARCQWM